MTTADSFAFSSILKLTTAFHYGWVDFADAVKDATSLGEVFDRIEAAMYAWEEADLGSPVSPPLTYERWSGQLVWGVRDDGTLEAVVERPDGPVISILLDVDGVASFHFHPERDREPCLIEAGRWIAKALNIESEYIEAVPPREFHAWRAAQA